MSPDQATEAIDVDATGGRSVVIAQLTMPTSTATSQTARFGAQGRTSIRGRDWEENCITVLLGGSEHGQGSHVTGGAGVHPGTSTPGAPPPTPCVPSRGNWYCHCDGGTQVTAGETCPSSPAGGGSGPPPPPTPQIHTGPQASTPWLSQYIPSDPNCPLPDVRSRLAELDAICCANQPGQQNCDITVLHGAPSGCSVACGAKLTSFYRQCNSTLDILFDGMDDEYDGHAQVFEDLMTTCLEIPSTSVIQELKNLEDQGCVVNANGIGEMVVSNGGAPVDADCQDSGPHKMCSLVTSGALSCATDFCADSKACAHAGECDLTCGFCTSPGDGGGRRALQIDMNPADCSALNLQSKVAPVNGACCDEDGTCAGGGGLGVPTVCDAKCAIVYTPFYSDCEATLRSSFGGQPATLAAFSSLATTCNALPVDQLLEAVPNAICSATQSPDPPAEGGFGAWLDTMLDCPLGMLQQRTVYIDNACCADGACTAAGGPATCSISCAAPVLGGSSQGDCQKTLNTVLDGMDQTFDGTADIVTGLHSSCSLLSTTDVIAELKTMEDSGCGLASDGVGETSVVVGDQNCVDTGDDALCSLVNLGVLSCSVDFCADCPHASACDETCGFCTPGDAPPDGGGHRRAQINIADTSCDATDFPTRTAQVNTDCCDETNDHCAAGVPTTCDVKCAMTYLAYYSECAQQISASFSPLEQSQFASLTTA